MISRDEYFRRFVTYSDRGIEIGASYNPSFPKAEGWNVKVVDYITKEDLVEKYRHIPTADTSRVEEVDYLAEGSSFSSSIDRSLHGSFDYICGSHLLEHVCDFVGFFNECATLLREGGRVLIAIPDKRFSFDFFRPASTTGDILRGHWEKRRTHPADLYFQSTNVVCKSHGHPEWIIQHERPEFSFFYDIDRNKIFDTSEDILTERRKEYIDMHRWVFTPSSFLLASREIISLGLIPFEVESVDRGQGPNIFAVFKKSNGPASELTLKERMDLQFAIAIDNEVSAEFLRQSPQYEEVIKGVDLEEKTASFVRSALADLSFLKERVRQVEDQASALADLPVGTDVLPLGEPAPVPSSVPVDEPPPKKKNLLSRANRAVRRRINEIFTHG